MCHTNIVHRCAGIASTIAATGRRAGTMVAATGRTRWATGRAFLAALPIPFPAFLKKFFCWGASELKLNSIFNDSVLYDIPILYFYICFIIFVKNL